jgi:hypothetical protein
VYHRGLSALILFAGALVVAFAGAACGGNAQPTPTAVVTPTPTVGETAMPTSDLTATPTATVTASTPSATVTASPSASPSESASVVPSRSPSRTASARPTSPPAVCTGWPAFQAYFLDAARKMNFAVYCGRMGKGWSLGSADYELPQTGRWFKLTYNGPGGATVGISEGAFCLTSPAACSPNKTILATGSFASLSGNLDLTVGGFAIYINPGTKTAYQITCTGLTQLAFQDIAANLGLVRKS